MLVLDVGKCTALVSIFQGGGAQKLGIAYMIRLAFKYFSDKKS